MCMSEPLELDRALRSRVWFLQGNAGVYEWSSKRSTRVGILAVQMWFLVWVNTLMHTELSDLTGNVIWGQLLIWRLLENLATSLEDTSNGKYRLFQGSSLFLQNVVLFLYSSNWNLPQEWDELKVLNERAIEHVCCQFLKVNTYPGTS